jgi:hypothetical protein
MCLEKVTSKAKILNASVHLPRIGYGHAGGKGEFIEPMVKDTLCSAYIST